MNCQGHITHFCFKTKHLLFVVQKSPEESFVYLRTYYLCNTSQIRIIFIRFACSIVDFCLWWENDYVCYSCLHIQIWYLYPNSPLINWANFNFLLSIVSKICSHFLKDNRELLELQLIIIKYKTFVKQRIPYWIHLLIWVLLLYLRNCKTLISWNPLHNMILKVDLIRECMATWPFFYCRTNIMISID